nr:MAG: hypothetical protein [Caudoviricetes sp.]
MNIYIQQITDLSKQNKYLKWYLNIIERAIQRASTKRKAKELLGYCEKHHIVPECFFKERTKGFLMGIRIIRITLHFSQQKNTFFVIYF